jgi:hypothetical protein
MQDNNKVYTSIIEEAAANIPGLDLSNEWQWCYKENTTYIDCPIANYNRHNTSIIVAIHNPSSTTVTNPRVSLPAGTYTV